MKRGREHCGRPMKNLGIQVGLCVKVLGPMDVRVFWNVWMVVLVVRELFLDLFCFVLHRVPA